MENALIIQQAKRLVIRKYRMLRLKIWLEVVLLSMAMAAFFSILLLKLGPVFTSFSYLFSGAFVSLFLALFFLRKLYRSDLQKAVSFLDYNYPELEDSVSLLFKDREELGGLAQWQQVRTARQLLKEKIRLPYTISRSVFVALCFLLSGWLFQSVPEASFTNQPQNESLQSQKGTLATEATQPSIEKLLVRIKAPAYTKIKPKRQSKPEIKAIQFSQVNWELTFTGSVNRAALLFNESDTVTLQQKGGKYRAEQTLQNPSYYRVLWLTETKKWETTDFYPIEIIEDQPPVIRILENEQYQKLKVEEKSLDLSARITDDFGVKNAWIEATVSRGSGESVKFRELKLLFNEQLKGEKKSIQLTRSLIFDSLKMSPGDELYYKIIAQDNHRPKPLESSSETYIAVLEDTAVQYMTDSKGMAVDLMPEYFRSQRQIIIDTEKLIAKKRTISSDDFTRESNSLGADQKILRLRYGQFLGEEFESSIEEGTEHKVEMLRHEQEHQEGKEHEEDEHETLEASAHNHDEHAESPDESGFTFGEGGGMLTAMMHNHDPEGVSTYFDKEIRALLKAALAQMWEAELHLRLAAPEKALPYEYKALEIIKKVQQKSRVYVARLGFDPPPLNPAEKRLTGELNEINNFRETYNTNSPLSFPQIRSALPALDQLIQSEGYLDDVHKEKLNKAGQELASESLGNGGKYLQTLSRIREVIKGVENKEQRIHSLKQIRKTFIQLLPEAPVEASPGYEFKEPLDVLYREELSQ